MDKYSRKIIGTEGLATGHIVAKTECIEIRMTVPQDKNLYQYEAIRDEIGNGLADMAWIITVFMECDVSFLRKFLKEMTITADAIEEDFNDKQGRKS